MYFLFWLKHKIIIRSSSCSTKKNNQAYPTIEKHLVNSISDLFLLTLKLQIERNEKHKSKLDVLLEVGSILKESKRDWGKGEG